MTQWILSQLEDRPDLVEKSVPPYPPLAERIQQDNGPWLGGLKKANVAVTIVENEQRMRVSVSVFNNHDDIDRLVSALKA